MQRAGMLLLAAIVTWASPSVLHADKAPVEFRRGPARTPPQDPGAPQSDQTGGRAPVEFRRPGVPPPSGAPAPAPTAPLSSVPPAGAPLSVWALQPEEAAPFDPRRRPTQHVVAAGETLFSISVRYQIPLRPLIEANGVEAPFNLEVGQRLVLPPPQLHRVAAGETLLGIARQYNIDARSLALLNRLEKPYEVRPGDSLALPALARVAPPPVSEQPTPPAPPPQAGRTRFAWPLIGPLLTRFGPQPGGKRSDGVDIAAKPGSDVKAAADGRVVYAGADIAGYGNLLLVQHAQGFVTAYAHCAQIAVREGESVRQGQTLAKVAAEQGGQGRLHFQIRGVGGRATDPLAALPPI